MRYIIYPAVNKVICVSRGVMEDYISNWGLPETKGVVIYNPFEIERIREMAKESVDFTWFRNGSPVIVACGRLAAEKNYPLLLAAFRKVAKNTPRVRLIVLGDGVLKEKLVALAKDCSISEQVLFQGFVANPYKYIARSTFLVSSSDWEGFGNVLVEAMACGIPVISTNCPSGPKEIIQAGENGFLVPVNDSAALADSMIALLNDPGLREKFSREGTIRVARYDAQGVVRMYEDQFAR